MLYLKRIFATIVLMCYIANSNSLQVRSYDRSWTLPNNSSKELVQGTLFATDDNSFPYASCKTTKQNEEKVCNITQVRQNHKDRTCDGVKIFAENGYELFLGGYFQVIPFTDDHVILAWWDNTKPEGADTEDSESKKQNLKISILNMVNCKTSNLNFPIDRVEFSFLPTVLFYPNHVEIILDSKASCEGADNCRLTYDLDGKKIGNAKPFLPSILGYSMPVSPASPEKGFFMYVRDMKNMTVMLVNTAGKGKELLTDKFGPDDLEQRVAFSNAHELYSICRLPEMENVTSTNIHCSQFDADGKVKVQKIITLPDNLNWLSVRSLPKGGILLVTSGCDVKKEDCKTINVWKIGLDGQSTKLDTINELELKCKNQPVDLQARISESFQTHEYCFDFGCLENSSNLKFNSKCILKSDLLK